MVLFRNIHIEKLILSKFIVELEEKQKSKNYKQATFNECADRHLEMCKKKTLEDDEEYIHGLQAYLLTPNEKNRINSIPKISRTMEMYKGI